MKNISLRLFFIFVCPAHWVYFSCFQACLSSTYWTIYSTVLESWFLREAQSIRSLTPDLKGELLHGLLVYTHWILCVWTLVQHFVQYMDVMKAFDWAGEYDSISPLHVNSVQWNVMLSLYFNYIFVVFPHIFITSYYLWDERSSNSSVKKYKHFFSSFNFGSYMHDRLAFFFFLSSTAHSYFPKSTSLVYRYATFVNCCTSKNMTCEYVLFVGASLPSPPSPYKFLCSPVRNWIKRYSSQISSFYFRSGLHFSVPFNLYMWEDDP